jgi:hypothetical protein
VKKKDDDDDDDDEAERTEAPRQRTGAVARPPVTFLARAPSFLTVHSPIGLKEPAAFALLFFDLEPTPSPGLDSPRAGVKRPGDDDLDDGRPPPDLRYDFGEGPLHSVDALSPSTYSDGDVEIKPLIDVKPQIKLEVVPKDEEVQFFKSPDKMSRDNAQPQMKSNVKDIDNLLEDLNRDIPAFQLGIDKTDEYYQSLQVIQNEFKKLGQLAEEKPPLPP